jgi:hypothetical protein
MRTIRWISAVVLLCLGFQLNAEFSYEYLNWKVPKEKSIVESDYYLVFLVCARHLDYGNSQKLFKTLVKHASGGKNADVGHSWILLHGQLDGREVTIEGGQSGELGIDRPKYYDGIMNLYEYGYANPTSSQKRQARHEPNPVKYLWADVDDGFFQEGNGGFSPTFAAKMDLTKEQFEAIYRFIDPKNYNYRHYSLVGQQCSSFLAKIAQITGVPVDHRVSIEIDPFLKVWGEKVRLWTDSQFSRISFSAPEPIERSLMDAVRSGTAENALYWYRKEGKRLRKHHITDRRERQSRFYETLLRYPYRLYRAATI